LDHGAEGVPIHVALRLVLDRCDRRADALALLRSLDLSASSCITVADGDGVAAFELSPAGCGVVSPDDRGHLVHANHFVGALPAGADLEIADGPGSQLRQAHLEAALARDGFDPALLQAHNEGPEPVCRHDDPAVAWADRIATLATVSLDPARGRFDVALGRPCATPLEALELP
jgi:isopenicillin-N N-acyltransferase-like protein